MQNAVLYQAYGGIDFINECRYSLLKYLQVYNLNPPASTGIYIYTDQPHHFSELLPYFPRLVCIPFHQETVEKWRGKQGFVHRLKIEMIKDFFQRFEGNVLYCDTDTYVIAPLEEIFREIEQGIYYMHEYEGVIDKSKYPSFHKWEKFLSTTLVEYNGKKLQFARTLQMFNAGVVGLNAASRDVLPDVLALTDSIYEKFPKHIAEQFAFSYCLQQRNRIKSADQAIAHYWNLKEFRQLLSRFFSKNLEESIPSLVKKVHHLDALEIMHQKIAFKRRPLLLRYWKMLNGSRWRIEAYEKKL